MRVAWVLSLLVSLGCFAAALMNSVGAGFCEYEDAPCANDAQDAAFWWKAGLVVYGVTAVLAYIRLRQKRRSERNGHD